jgi:flagellar protein FliL
MSEVAKPKKSNNLFKIIIVVFLGLLLVGGSSFVGYYFASKDKAEPQASTTEKQIEEVYFLAGEFLLNLADTDSRKIIKTKISIGYDSENKKLASELDGKKDVIEDAIINVIRSKTSKQFSGTGDQDVKKEILLRVNSILETGKAVHVYYKDLIIQ